MTANTFINELKTIWADLNLQSIDELKKIYREDLIFNDPANAIQGREKFLDHMRYSYRNVISCTFDFDTSREIIVDDQALLNWTMHYQHKSVGGGKMISMNGVSLLKMDNGIYFHQDWFDLGAMLYEHVPVVGGLIRFIKTKVTAKS